MYVGKTIQALHERVNGHRSSFYDSIKKFKLKGSLDNVKIDDANILGAHLVLEHQKYEQSDFNASYVFDIISTTTPSNLRYLEQLNIEKLKTLSPFGLNQINSIC